MSHLLSSIEPVAFWDHFYRLSQIPRPSRGEAAVCRHIFDLARELGLEVFMDEAGGAEFGNLIVRLPATPGHEAAPMVVFQSHVDMVALPEQRREHPLDLFLDGTMLRARGSTLGADNGLAVAIALTLMTSPDIVHGPLELLFTINEEAGMTGALFLGRDVLRGRRLINMDTLTEGILTICCAGACHSDLCLPVVGESVPEGLVAVQIGVTGGRGGHSGLEINSGRANAGQVLARLLYEQSGSVALYLQDIRWGEVMNAIPGEARATVFVAPDVLAFWQRNLPVWQAAFREEFGGGDDSLRAVLETAEVVPAAALGHGDTRRVLAFLLSLPHGVYTMSSELPGVVETSSTVAVVCMSPSELTVTVSQRGLTDPSLDAVIAQCEAVSHLAGARCTHIGKHYGWKPDLSSPLLALCREAYRETYGRDPLVTGLHGMLECGIIKEKYPLMDAISFGTAVLDAHAPTKPDYVMGVDRETTGERMDVSAMPRFWEYVRGVLRRLAQVPV